MSEQIKEFLRKNPNASRKQVAEGLGISKSAATYQLQSLAI
jgi:predicted ArsR family transcriptional regulator